MSFELFPGSGAGGSDPAADVPGPDAPLAERLRPRTLAEVVGQEHLTAPDRLLGRLQAGANLPSLIFWGAPGTGKTTLARILARGCGAAFIGLSAVSAGVKEVRGAVEAARRNRRAGRRTVLFLDEIHRFNKAQQDALLPTVESGLLILLGATTENPSFEVNSALLSRCRVVVLKELDEAALEKLLDRALTDRDRGLGERGLRLDSQARGALIRGADGDARRLLNTLEVIDELTPGSSEEGRPVGGEVVREALQAAALRYDRAGEEHYNLISALHKSVRASDPQGAVYWTERMLAAGEDPLYVARRLVRMAVEDVGLADPDALPRTVAARDAVHFLGLPEGAAALAQAAVYLALAPKSNRIYRAELAVREAIDRTGSLPVPPVFRNPVTGLMKGLGYGRGYRYDHDFEDAVSGQKGLPEELAGTRFYEPSPRGFERELADRLRKLEARKPPAEPPDSPDGE
jgi:putative ATPase